MSDPLATYLHDHLAGSHFAIKLLESLHEQYRDEALGSFALALKADIKEDQDTLQEIIRYVGETHLDLSKIAGWVAERASQLKLHRADSDSGLGTFEALETLVLGIRGKLALWHALAQILKFDPRVAKFDYAALSARAEEQSARAEDQRLRLLSTTFAQKIAERT